MNEHQPLEQISLFDNLEIVRNFEQGKDELNLAEFPICSIYKVRDNSIKTLHFQDQVEDKATGKMVDRKLTVTASDQFGLPCAFDDEVILALIQLTKLQGFLNRKVYFTKRQILEILGWDSGGKNTKRVEESLKRWLGVTLVYDQAWRDIEDQSWDSKGFHILEEVFFREHQHDPRGKASYIVWNETVFRSMASGNLKSLDFAYFKQLRCPTAKRIFRFLDKRFYHRNSLRFDLSEFAYQKIGIDQRYRPAEIKRKLAAGIKELEQVGFLVAMNDKDRYRKVGAKKWNIYFERGSSAQKSLPIKVDPVTELEGRMIALGVNKSRARKLFDAHSPELLEIKIEHLEFLMSRSETKPKNPAGFFVKSITEDYAEPDGFKSKADKERAKKYYEDKKAERLERKRKEDEAKQRMEDEENRIEEEKAAKVEAYLVSLGEERESFVEKAYEVARQDHTQAGWIDEDSVIGKITREIAVSNMVFSILDGDDLDES